MSTPPDLDLEPHQFRELPDKPLGKPSELRRSLALFLIAAVFCAGVTAWQGQGSPWFAFCLALTTIPPAMWAGAVLAGLWPRWFFSKGDDDI